MSSTGGVPPRSRVRPNYEQADIYVHPITRPPAGVDVNPYGRCELEGKARQDGAKRHAIANAPGLALPRRCCGSGQRLLVARDRRQDTVPSTSVHRRCCQLAVKGRRRPPRESGSLAPSR